MIEYQMNSSFDWDSFLLLLKKDMDDLSFDSWIKPLTFIEVKGNVLYMGSPSRFIKNWVEMNYKEDILKNLQDNYPVISIFEIVVSSFYENATDPEAQSLETEHNDKLISKECENTNAVFNSLEIKLNPDFKFDNFVVGNPNEFAYNAAKKVALEDKVYFNPLFIYGGVGLGKTHLMHSIAWSLIESSSKRSFLYLTAEKFMNLYIVALRDRNIISFKEMFRSTDVLMIDDFQFISGKEGTQEEFFHTFNTLISQGKQIVLSADQSPLSLNKVEDRILSRLQAGLAVDIHATTYELRMGILESKVAQWEVSIPRDVLDFLAHTITSNVRELEGGLKRVVTYHQLMGTKIDLNMAMSVLEDILKYKNKTISIELIQKKVAEYYNIKLVDMSSSKKDKMTSTARHIAMYIAKNITKYSLPEIGRKFGGRDHTTVLYSVKKINEVLKTNLALENEIKLLVNIIQKS